MMTHNRNIAQKFKDRTNDSMTKDHSLNAKVLLPLFSLSWPGITETILVVLVPENKNESNIM